MKFYVALCLFGAVAAGLAMPQDHPTMEHPIFRPPQLHHNRPDFHHPRPPMHPGHPSHPMPPHHELGPELREFMRHVRDFIELYPRREIRNIIRSRIHDPELRATMMFLRSPEFKQIMHTIASTPEFEAIGRYFSEADWPWFQNTIDEAVRDIQVEALPIGKRNTGGLNALIDEIIAILPKEQLRALFEEKMANSAVFRSVIEIMSSTELKALIENAKESSVIREQFGLLLAQGIDMEKICESKKALVGF